MPPAEPQPPLTRRCAAEALGSFALVFFGTGAMAVDAAGAGLGPAGVAASFGLVVMAMIYALGDVSGAHLNPAVTAGFWLAGRFPRREILPYAGSQVAGAAAASLLLASVLPQLMPIGLTLPAGGVAPALLFEVLLTATLMFVILGVSTGAREKGLMAGIAVGATVALAALVGGPVSGASMNPARSLGPALAAGQWAAIWLYVVGPLLGAGLAVLGCRCVRTPDCCGGNARQLPG